MAIIRIPKMTLNAAEEANLRRYITANLSENEIADLMDMPVQSVIHWIDKITTADSKERERQLITRGTATKILELLEQPLEL